MSEPSSSSSPDEAAGKGPLPSAAAAEPPPICRVVLIEERAEARAEARRLLALGSDRQYEFIEAETAAEGLRFIESSDPPDCVILGQRLPDAAALDALAAMSGPDGPLCPVVALIGAAGREAGLAAIRAGAQDFVGEAWLTPESLARAVESAIERWSADRARAEAARRSAIGRAAAPDLRDAKQAEERLATTLGHMERALRSRDELLSLVSHDLKNPLGAMTMGIALLQKQLDEGGGPVALKRFSVVLSRMSRQAARMERLIDEILDAARLRSGSPLVLERCETDLVAIARAAAEEHQRPAPNHRIEVRPASERVVGSWDPRRIERVVSNLLSNAIKYSPAGGSVLVEIESAQEESATWAILRVKDEGIGIAEEDRASVFEWYSRGENARRTGIQGTGIGLAGARDIVERHGGSISVESEPGAGSTFTVRLPMQPIAIEPRSEGPSSVVASERSRPDEAPVERECAETEAELSRTRERFESALVAGNVAVWVWDISRNQVFADENLRDLFNVSDEAARYGPASAYLEAIHPNDRPHVVEAIGEALRSGSTYKTEYRVTDASGALHWLLARGRIERDAAGRAVRMHGAICDMTDKKRVEERLAAIEERAEERAARLALLLDVTGALVSGGEDEASLARIIFEKLRGPLNADICVNYRLDEARSEFRLVAGFGIPPEHEAEIQSFAMGVGLCGMIAATGKAISVDAAMAAIDERAAALRMLDIHAYAGNPLLSRDGGILGTFALASTHRDCFTTSEIEFLQTLCHFLSLAWERMAAERTLRRAVALRDDFLAVASHELRTPLTALGLQLEGLQRLMPAQGAGSGDRAAKKLEVAIRQSERLGALVEALLDVSRIAAGQLRFQFESFDLRALVLSTLERLSGALERAGVEIRLSPGEEAVGVWDRSRIEQVLMSLLANAIKYGPGSPVDIRVAATEAAVELTVSDRGIGIAKEDQARIFGRFERAVPAKNYGGLGLGLYMARQIVEAHGGEIEVESSPGQGATFLVRLPRRAAGGHRIE